jgi:hypothetical protein
MAKKVEAPADKDAAAVAPKKAASKPVHKAKNINKAKSVKKADATAPVAPASK